MRKLGIINLMIGLIIIAFPSFIGSFLIGSAAMLIAFLSLFAMITFYLGRRYLGAILSLVFLLASVRMMYHPQLLLKYFGAALILSSLIQILVMRRNAILISSGITLVLGILAYINSHASLVVTSVILGILFVGLGGTMLIWDYFVTGSPIYFRSGRRRTFDVHAERNVKIDEEIEEAEFTEVDD